MCAVRVRVGCYKPCFLVFMRPVSNSYKTIYFLLQCLPSFNIIEYVYKQSESLLLTFFTFVCKYWLQFYDELCIFGQPRDSLILRDVETHSICHMYLFLFCLGFKLLTTKMIVKEKQTVFFLLQFIKTLYIIGIK